ncbi:MAG: PGPGW domain-containing protein [Desulfobacteraceae bacterium]|nr:PGPGW domain-containing protein [Desulfobacteraceae bacterium]
MKNHKSFLSTTYRTARRIVVAVVGTTLLVIGLFMIVLPGPAMVVIPLGLGVLSLEFAWARRWLQKVKQRAAQMVNRKREKGHAD